MLVALANLHVGGGGALCVLQASSSAHNMQSHPGTDQAEALLAASHAGPALAPAVLVMMQQQLCSAGRQLQRRRALHTRYTWLVSELTQTKKVHGLQNEAKMGQRWSP